MICNSLVYFIIKEFKYFVLSISLNELELSWKSLASFITFNELGELNLVYKLNEH